MAKIFLDLAKRIKHHLTRIVSKLRFKSTTESFYGYDDITLKLYLEVAATSSILRLQKTGKKNLEKCVEVWENIIMINAEKNKDFEYSTLIAVKKQLALYVCEYLIVKGMLTKLTISVDKEVIKYLKRKGYNINTTSTEKYEESLINALRRSDNLITKTKMKENELKGLLATSGNTKASDINLEEVLGHLSAGLGYSVDNSLTLARYNTYKDILKVKNGRQRGNKA